MIRNPSFHSSLMATTSDSSVVELREVHALPQPKALLTRITSRLSRTRSGPETALNEPDVNNALPGPMTAPEWQQERWNSSRTMVFRVLAAFWGFIIMGANDAAVGALIPYLQAYYDLSYSVVALLFLSPMVGYTLAAMLNNVTHMKLGQRGIAIICPTCHLVAFLVAALHPPFPTIVVFVALSGFGNGLEDSAWNAWIGNMANANELLGFLHGFYGLGATVAPLIATSMITRANLPWYTFYYLMVGLAVIELVTLTTSFWTATAERYRELHPRTSAETGNRMTEALWRMPAARVTWLCAIFLFGYVGVEVALGGWITTFMLDVRHSSRFASGMSATGFWLGMTIGRVVLGFVTPRIGETLAIMIYIPIVMALELIFWLVPQFYVSTVAVAFQGFFLGPLFPASVVAVSKLLPRHLHVRSIGFSAAFGGGGAAIFPFAVGAIAQAKGVKVLQPIVLSVLAIIFMLWCGLPHMRKKKD